ncbi:MAG: hypothetical protein GY856_18110 [bacterium]|nr:hypothetical protein [bacterium]
MGKRRRPDLALILVVGMVVALLPGLFTSEIEFGSLTVRTEQLFLGYWVVVMTVLGVGGAIEARKRIAEAFHIHRWVRGIFLVLIWACALTICGLVLWRLLLVLVT